MWAMFNRHIRVESVVVIKTANALAKKHPIRANSGYAFGEMVAITVSRHSRRVGRHATARQKPR
jgi:redox-regulated HSP33 family molecular chaperone